MDSPPCLRRIAYSLPTKHKLNSSMGPSTIFSEHPSHHGSHRPLISSPSPDLPVIIEMASLSSLTEFIPQHQLKLQRGSGPPRMEHSQHH